MNDAPERSGGTAPPARRPRIVVAGAAGFVGRALLPLLAERGDVVALSRSAAGRDLEAPVDPRLRWRRCDLFSLRETEEALADADFAVYLVHSMEPSARLTQASFADLDLLLAENFARAAAAGGVRQIVYLGGLVPDEPALSPHLASRLEVERALGSRGVPVTAVRAGLVVGAGGSSFRILVKLARRLPVMACPRWTANPTQPIALDDVVALLAACVGDPATYGETYDVGGPEVMTYREMLLRTAGLLGMHRLALPVPFLTPRLSRLWVSAVTGSARALVAPLVESLRHPMVARDRRLQERLGRDGAGFDEAVRRALEIEAGAPLATARSGPPVRRKREDSDVRSVQRLPLPPGQDAAWVAREYLRWLPRFVWPFLRVDTDGTRCWFRLRPFGVTLLALTLVSARSTPDRQVFRITGGALAWPRRDGLGRLEFRSALDGAWLLAAIHDYVPTLPWWLYNATQARVHLWVMRGFGRHLARCAARAPDQWKIEKVSTT